MSVQEARKVAITMGKESFAPPPRRIDDILQLLSEPGQFDPKITLENRAIADKYPPENANDLILSDFYLSRGEAAIRINRFQQALEDLRTAYQYAKNAGRKDALFLRPLATAELWAGSSKQAIKLFERSLKREERCSIYTSLVTAYSRIGDLDSAESYKKRGISICGKSNDVWNRIYMESMKADVLEMRGKFAEAELHRRRIMRLAPSIKKDGPAYYIALRACTSRERKERS